MTDRIQTPQGTEVKRLSEKSYRVTIPGFRSKVLKVEGHAYGFETIVSGRVICSDGSLQECVNAAARYLLR